MAKTRTQKAALNTATAALSEIVMLVCGLILPRLILRNYGSAYNGITSSAKQFLSAISILNVGIAGTTRVALYKSLASHDLQKTSGIVKATELHMRKVGLVLTAYVAALMVFYPIFVDTGYGWMEVAPLIFAASLSSFGRYFFGTAYRAFLTADQSVYITNIFSIASNLLNTLVNVILIRAGCSIQVVRVSAALVLLLNPILLSTYVKRKYKLDRHCKPDKSALSMRRDVMAHSIANIVHDHTDMVVLTIFTDVKIVSVYTVYNLVMSALKKTQMVFTSGTEAVFGNMWAKGELDKIKLNLGYYEYIVSSFVSVVFSTTLVMILPFISLYTKGVHDVEYILPAYAAVITIAQAFYCFRAPYLTLIQGVGHYKQTKRGAYVEAGMNLVLSVLLVQFIGIVGVAVGTLCANVFRTCQYALYADKHLVKRGKLVFILRIVWACANSAVVYFASRLVFSGFLCDSWFKWVLFAFMVTVFSGIVTLLSSLVFYRRDMIGVKGILLRVIRRKKRRKAA
jgi:Na+-driven multidrug efflux pump